MKSIIALELNREIYAVEFSKESVSRLRDVEASIEDSYQVGQISYDEYHALLKDVRDHMDRIETGKRGVDRVTDLIVQGGQLIGKGFWIVVAILLLRACN